MAYEIINFNKKDIEAIKAPEASNRAYYRDKKIATLVLMVTDKGKKSFQVYRKFNGKPIRVTLGGFPDLSVENARSMALEANNKIARGINPNQDKKKIRQEQTFKELFATYMTRYSKPHKKSSDYDQEQYDRHIKPVFENMRLSEITKDKLQKFHLKIAESSGKITANRLIDIISSVFSKAIEWEMYMLENPTRFINKFKEQSRDRFLSKDELPAIFAALEDFTTKEGYIIESRKKVRDYVLLSLFTGARKSNVVSMKWSDIDFNRAEWYIKETKNGTPQRVTLVTQALQILQERKDSLETQSSEYVFPAESKSGHMIDPKRAWKDLLERAKISDLRIHDLRRTLGSWQAITGSSLPIIGKSLNHKSSASTMIYARLDQDPVRNSMQNAVNAMLDS